MKARTDRKASQEEDKENIDPKLKRSASSSSREHASTGISTLYGGGAYRSSSDEVEKDTRRKAELLSGLMKDLSLSGIDSEVPPNRTIKEVSSFAVDWIWKKMEEKKTYGVEANSSKELVGASFEVFNKCEYLGRIGNIRPGKEAQMQGQLHTSSFDQGPIPVLAARFMAEEKGATPVFVSAKNDENMLRFYEKLRSGLQVALADFTRDRNGNQLNHAVVVPFPVKGKFMIVLSTKRVWTTWLTVLKRRKLYIGVDLDRTVVDCYTLEKLEAVIRSAELSEREKALAILHLSALNHYRNTNMMPQYLRALYRDIGVPDEKGAISICRENGGRVVLTRYANGDPILVLVRPGWEALLSVFKADYYTCFITQGSSIHASTVLEALGAHALEETDESGIGLKVICRDADNKKTYKKSFSLAGAGATKCFVGLDDLLDGSDESRSNAEGVSIWERDDLKVVLKPVPYHAYSEEAGQSDQVPLEMCSILLKSIHHRFFSAVDQVLDSPNVCDVFSQELPRLDSILAYYGRNNITSAQAVASFVNKTIQNFQKKE
eukprot:CAMPEP_0198239922 /NCGR_PEP_ID=MMETSP1446-20131203/5188_1 /TAXON_ID=1461542 ORGANISM="Unidentified sp, Strain CCMP2111" /NCGR_SAMPLE_ID=MMETSP1446 /ASSEMBLY_ACC=CAM_ASM_001112 /LENGTH=548 /DNA_ID=CAMNT_0043922589 /DNA_START=248 /DNA_END=1894 /DNA_ORIENTATION=+